MTWPNSNRVHRINCGGFKSKITHTRGGSRIPHRRGRQPSKGRQHMILPNFAKNCMELRKFLAVGGPPRSATAHEQICLLKCHGDILPVVKIQNRRGCFFSRCLYPSIDLKYCRKKKHCYMYEPPPPSAPLVLLIS